MFADEQPGSSDSIEGKRKRDDDPDDEEQPQEKKKRSEPWVRRLF